MNKAPGRDTDGICYISHNRIWIDYSVSLIDKGFHIKLYIDAKLQHTVSVDFGQESFECKLDGLESESKAEILIKMDKTALPNNQTGYDWFWSGEWCTLENGYWHCLKRNNLKAFYSYAMYSRENT